MKLKSHLIQFLLPLLGGILYSLGFPNIWHVQWFLFPVLGMSALLCSLDFALYPQTVKWRRNIGSILLFGLSFNVFSFYWIPYTLEVFGGLPNFISWGIGLLFSFIIVPQFFIFLLLMGLGEKFLTKLSLSTRHWIIALVFTLCEYFTPQQFPAHMGHSWLTIAPYLAAAPLFGYIIFSFCNFLLALVLSTWIKQKGKDFFSLGIFILFFVANFLFPLTIPRPASPVHTYVRIVQPNIGNYLKISSENGHKDALSEVYDTYQNLSNEASQHPLDFIIWPETAYPHTLISQYFRTQLATPSQFIQKIAQTTGAELLIGGYDRKVQVQAMEENFETHYNAAFFFDQQGKFKDVYHKQKLIPFGETLPFGPFNQWLSQFVQNISYFSRGERFTTFTTRQGIHFSTAICYELLFPEYIRQLLNQGQAQAHFLLNITNDSWYGQTMEPHQHLFLAKWRALEFQLPVIRSTNTGISAIFYPDGSEGRRLGIFQRGILDIDLVTAQKNEHITLFQRFGVIPFLAIWSLVLLAYRLAYWGGGFLRNFWRKN